MVGRPLPHQSCPPPSCLQGVYIHSGGGSWKTLGFLFDALVSRRCMFSALCLLQPPTDSKAIFPALRSGGG